MHVLLMRIQALAIVIFSIVSAACTQSPRPISHQLPGPQSPPKTEYSNNPSQKEIQKSEASTSPRQKLEFRRRNLSGIEFEGVVFDGRDHRLAVVDQAKGPGSEFPDSHSAASSRHALAGFNAGFFTPEGAPLGKLVAGGRAAGSWNSSSLGSGIFSDNSGVMKISRRAGTSIPSGTTELLQAGPMLVEHGKSISRLDTEKPAVRMFIAWDGGNRWWIGKTSVCSLAQLSATLGKSSPADWPVQMALNLDGGRSTDLWVSDHVPGGPAEYRTFWNRPVRNFLVLLTR